LPNTEELKTGNQLLSCLSLQKFKDFQVFILAGSANIPKFEQPKLAVKNDKTHK
jgi:hypothetical protein